MGQCESFRKLQQPGSDLPDLLVTLRGAASHQQVGSVAGVRPVRIKELEQGIGDPENLVTLKKLLKVYGARIGVAMRD